MKKFIVTLIALSTLLFAACISFSFSSSNIDEDGYTTVKGVLQNDGKDYFIIIGEQAVENQEFTRSTFYFEENADSPDAWDNLVSSVGRKISVEGYVTESYDDNTYSVSVSKVH
jgi:hypothetical protein